MTVTEDELIRAIQHHEAGRLVEAERLYREVLHNAPNHPNALRLLGIVTMQNGQPAQAVDLIRRAIALNPGAAEYHVNLGNALKANGNIDDAIEAYRQALKLKPRYPQAQYNLGIALAEKSQLKEAAATYQRALEMKPDYPEALMNLGVVLDQLGRREEAIAAYRHAIRLRPDHADAYNNLAKSLREHGNVDESITACQQALRLKPNSVEALNNLGVALEMKEDLDQAIAAYHRAIAVKPDAADAYNNLGNALKAKRCWREAVESYEQAAALRPQWPEPHWNLAILLLLLGDFQRGWAEYEWRWQWSEFASNRRNFSQPRWDGLELAGQTILLHTEQGFGDAIQFIRYAPMVATRGGRVIVECRPELARLLASAAGIERVVAGGPLPPFDVQCPLMSLPFLFGTRLDTCPRQIPYVRVESTLYDHWQRKVQGHEGQLHLPSAPSPGPPGEGWGEGHFVSLLTRKTSPQPSPMSTWERGQIPNATALQGRGAGIRVGLVWAGKPTYLNDRHRSMQLSQLAPLARVEGVTFFSLQKGQAAEQIARDSRGLQLIDLAADLRDFADTAALVAQLDLVIAVDTAVAHLTGALGKPVWVLLPELPDYRWMLEREDSPWYPTLRLFRQKTPGDWAGVIECVAGALEAFVAGKTEQRIDYNAQGIALAEKDRLDEAIAAFEKAIITNPRDPHPHNNLALAFKGKRNFDRAVDSFRRAIALQQDYAEAHNNLAVTLAENGRHDEAVESYRNAIRLRPGYADAYNNMGVCLAAQRRFDEALAAYQTALQLKNDYAEAFSNQGNLLTQLERYDEAMASLEQGLRLQPNSYVMHNNLGIALGKKGQFSKAIECSRAALRLNLGYLDGYKNLAIALASNGQFDEAIEMYHRAFQFDPAWAEGHWNLALILLSLGRFDEGWHEYEWRWKWQNFPSERRQFSQPVWDGSRLDGKTILLYPEQGFGDFIQFIRLAPLVKERGGSVILEAPLQLARLVQGIAGVDEVISDRTIPPFDVQCPLLTLPLLLGTRIESIPAQAPYLAVDPTISRAWAKRGNSADTRDKSLKVGLVWAGNPAHVNDRHRSIKLAQLAPLAAIRGVTFYSLQKGPASAQAANPPAGMELIDLTAEVRDFADTAGLMSQLDLVITVDTAAAHLAGAIGRRVWVLLVTKPDWRWMLERDDSPWYSTMRLFRQQSSGDWAAVITRVAEQLVILRDDKASRGR